MSVNLLATARLNIRPFLASLKALSAATAAQQSKDVAGTKATTKAQMSQIAAREAAARTAINSAKNLGAATAGANNAMKQGAVDAKLYNAALRDTYATQGRAINSMSKMTAAQQTQMRAVQQYNRAVAAQATARASGLEGPAMARVAAATETAANSVARANRAVTVENERLAASAARAAAAQMRVAASNQAVAKTGPAAASGLAAQRYLYHDMSRQLGTLGLVLAALPVASLAFAASWEKSFADVVRTADPAFSQVESRVKGLRTSLVQMVEAMPTSFGEVAEIATLANQMGIAASQTAAFTRAVSMFSATSGVSVDMAATAFGRLTSILGDNAVGFNVMSDSILKVGVNSVATEDEIINVTTQISSIAAQAGFSAQEMIGFAGALASVRVPPELSRGVVTRVFGTISRAASAGGSDLTNFARIAGMSAEDFQSSWGEKGSAAVLGNFLRGLQKLGPKAEAELRNLGITSVRDVPVILRLAMAADSEGVVGELFQQTQDDAHNAAGETQRQYTIMANTVVAKLKVLGNNLAGFFDAIGQSGLGPLGKIIDNISEGVRNLSRMVRDGEAEWLGWVITIGGVMSAVALLGSAVTKVIAGIRTMQHVSTLFSGGLSGAAKSAAPLYVDFGKVNEGIKQSTKSAGRFGGVVGRVGSTLGGAARTVSSMVFSWGGLIGGAAIAGSLMIAENLRSAGVEASTIAEKISTIDFSKAGANLQGQLDSVFKSLEVSNFGVSGTGEGLLDRMYGYSSAVKSAEEYRKVLKTISDLTATTKKEMQAQLDSRVTDVDGVSRGSAEWERYQATIKRFGQSLGDLVDSGNGVQAIAMLKELGLSSKDLNTQMEHSGVVRDYVDSLLEMNGIDPTAANRLKLINGEFQEITKAMSGLEDLEGIDLNDLFEGDLDAIGKLTAAIHDTIASFFDLGKARTDALNKDGNLDFGKFMQNMRDEAKAQQEWSDNLVKLGRVATEGLMQELLDAGPEMNDVVSKLLSNPEALAEMEAMFRDSAARAGGSAAEEILAASNKIRGLLGTELGQALVDSLSDTELTRLYGLFQKVGHNSAKEIAKGLSDGKYTLDEAIGRMELETQLKIDTDLNVDPAKLSLQVFKGIADGTITAVQLDALPALAKGKIWEVVELASGETGFVKIDAETGAAEDGIVHVVDEAGKTVGTVTLTADEAEALKKLRATKSTADDTTGIIKITANTDAANRLIDSAARTRTAFIDVIQRGVNNITGRGNSGVRDNRGGGTLWADGGIAEYYANGGVRESHIAQIAPAGTNRVWAEPETGGEAYIPLANSKRKRSLTILDDVANRFGMAIQPQNYTQFADGGTYLAQQQSRAINNSSVGRGVGRSYEKATNFNMTIVNPETRDPIKQAWDQSELWGNFSNV